MNCEGYESASLTDCFALIQTIEGLEMTPDFAVKMRESINILLKELGPRNTPLKTP